MILQMIHVNGVVDSIDIMLKANTIEDDDNDTKIEKEIKRFLHGDDNDDAMDSNDGTSTNRTYTPYDGPYSETP